MMVILQCAPLASWRALAVLWCYLQVGGYRPQFRPHRGVIWPVLISSLLELPLQVLSPNPTGPWRFSMRIQITPRCALIERNGQLTTGCRGAGCSVVKAVAEVVLIAVNDDFRRSEIERGDHFFEG